MRRGTSDGGREHLLLSFVVATLVALSCAPQSQPATIPAVVVPPRTPVVRSPAPAPAPARATEGEIDGGAGKLWYHIVGRGPDTVIVPLGTWLERALSPLGGTHAVVFYDPRHRGRSHALSDSLQATFDADVADLEAVRAAVGASRVAVIGYDYYAAVAAAWAAAHPQSVTRLVLVSPIEPADSLARSWNPPERMARIDTTAARALVKARAAGRDTADAAKYCEEFWSLNARLFVGDTARAKDVRADWCQLPNETPARVAAAAYGALGSLGPAIDFGARAGGLSVPTLVMQGRLDLVANPEGAREWTRRIPGARLLWLSNVGHLPHLEDQTVVLDAIRDFLAGGWPPRAGPP
jgi:proline iminopeptidase